MKKNANEKDFPAGFQGGPRLTRKDFLRSTAATAAVAALGGVAGLGGFARAARAALAGPVAERAIPSTGEKIPVVGLGTARVYDVEPGDPKLPTLKATVDTFVKNGGKVIDCSPTYGRSSEVIGRFIDELGVRDRIFLASKISIEGEAEGVAQLDQEMKNLRTDRLELLQVHNIKDVKAHLRTIRGLKEEGKVRYSGITVSSKRAYDDFAQIMKDEKFDFIQINYSLMQPESAEEILPLAQAEGRAVLINRPFYLARTFRKVKGVKLPEWAREFDAHTWAQFFLKFVLSHPAVTAAIPGTDKPEYMTDNLGAGVGRMPDRKMRAKMLAYWKTL